MTSADAAIYRVEAFNTATASENKIHDDETARRFGFGGGLVPGVEVYAYMTHLPLERFGPEWLARGGMECRFLKPVYDGHMVAVTGLPSSEGLSLSAVSEGALCAEGRAWHAVAPEPPPADAVRAPPPPALRPPASHDVLAVGRLLGIAPSTIDEAALHQYLADIRESAGLYAAQGLVHPGQILRLANQALLQNVVLGPWIHVASQVRNLAAPHIGQILTLNARISANYERKGHAFVELEALVAADGAPAALIRHTAIWRPRQVAEA